MIEKGKASKSNCVQRLKSQRLRERERELTGGKQRLSFDGREVELRR